MKKTKLIPFVAMAGLVASSLPLGLVTSCKSNDSESSEIAINLTGAAATYCSVDNVSISKSTGELNFTVVNNSSSYNDSDSKVVGITGASSSVSNSTDYFTFGSDYHFSRDKNNLSNLLVTVSQAKAQQLASSDAVLNIALNERSTSDASCINIVVNNANGKNISIPQVGYFDAVGNYVVDNIAITEAGIDYGYQSTTAYVFTDKFEKIPADNVYYQLTPNLDNNTQTLTISKGLADYCQNSFTVAFNPITYVVDNETATKWNDIQTSDNIELCPDTAGGSVTETSYLTGSNIGTSNLIRVRPTSQSNGDTKTWTNITIQECDEDGTPTGRWLVKNSEYYENVRDNGFTDVMLASGVTAKNIRINGTVVSGENQFTIPFNCTAQNMSQIASSTLGSYLGESNVIFGYDSASSTLTSTSLDFVVSLTSFAQQCNLSLSEHNVSNGQQSDATFYLYAYVKDGMGKVSKVAIDFDAYTCAASSSGIVGIQNSGLYTVSIAENAIANALSSQLGSQVSNLVNISAEFNLVQSHAE